MISTKKMTDDLTFRVSSDVVYIRSETHCGQMSSGEKEDRSGHLLLSLDTRFLQLVLHLLYLLSAFFRHNSYLIGITNKQTFYLLHQKSCNDTWFILLFNFIHNILKLFLANFSEITSKYNDF